MVRLLQAAAACAAAFVIAAFLPARTPLNAPVAAAHSELLTVGFHSTAQLEAAIRAEGGVVVRLVPSLRVAEVRIQPSDRASALARHPGISFVGRAVPRRAAVDQTSILSAAASGPEWQLRATHEDAVPNAVLRAAAAIRIAVIDTGADLAAPALAAKHPLTYDVGTGKKTTPDTNGHGTFVASLAAGAIRAGLGMVGSGGDAQLLIVRSGSGGGDITDVDEAAGIVYAVHHGARILNLSLGGPRPSKIERRAIHYATHRGVLVIAPVGNEYAAGNPVEYPAALLQPIGSNGAGGTGLAVTASTSTGQRAPFSNTGSSVSLAAPGMAVLGAVARLSSPKVYPRVSLEGVSTGLYGYGSGTSFAAPQVAGAAAIVWGADPALTAVQVAQILKETASGGGVWKPDLGYGVIDVAAAVAKAEAMAAASVTPPRA
jgi:subtilisin family serine protease